MVSLLLNRLTLSALCEAAQADIALPILRNVCVELLRELCEVRLCELVVADRR